MTVDDSWAPLSVVELVDLFRHVQGVWWLSGGWAIEEYTADGAAPRREHGDIDVTVARGDWQRVQAALAPVLQMWIAREGRLYDTATTSIDAGVDNLWAREPTGGPWRLQLNLEEITDGVWTYRRDSRISPSIADAAWWSGRIWCIAPAVQLLWKAQAPRPVDEHDYAQTVPSLPEEELRWLGCAIRLAHPASPWAGRPELADDR